MGLFGFFARGLHGFVSVCIVWLWVLCNVEVPVGVAVCGKADFNLEFRFRWEGWVVVNRCVLGVGGERCLV